jgi:hypothetical protein
MDDTSYRGIRQLAREREASFMLCLLAFGLKFPITLLWKMLKSCFVGVRRLANTGIQITRKNQ